MSHFLKALNIVILHEGGYSNNPNDLGGATNFGISLRFLKLVNGDINDDGHVDEADIKALLPDEVKGLYKTYFWDHYGLNGIYLEWVGIKAFDLFVNMRGRSACKIFQRSCVLLGFDLVIDGIIGPNTISAINAASVYNLQEFQHAIRSHQKQFYRDIVKRNPSQKQFINGWLNRARY